MGVQRKQVRVQGVRKWCAFDSEGNNLGLWSDVQSRRTVERYLHLDTPGIQKQEVLTRLEYLNNLSTKQNGVRMPLLQHHTPRVNGTKDTASEYVHWDGLPDRVQEYSGMSGGSVTDTFVEALVQIQLQVFTPDTDGLYCVNGIRYTALEIQSIASTSGSTQHSAGWYSMKAEREAAWSTECTRFDCDLQHISI